MSFPRSKATLLAAFSVIIASSEGIFQSSASLPWDGKLQWRQQANSTSPNCTAEDTFWPSGTAYNASGSYQVPGFAPPGTTTDAGNLTYNTAVRVSPSGDWYNQTVWIDTVDGTSIQSMDLPYVGCLTALIILPQSTVKRGQGDNGDCTETLGDECVNAMVNQVDQSLRNRAARNSTLPEDICGRLITPNDVPEACEMSTGGGGWGASATSYILGNGTDSDGCTDRSETGADGADLGWGRPRGCDESEVATCYDRAVTGVTPVITTVWQKEASPRADAGWSDVRVTCLRANRIQSGSRTPEGVPSLGVKVNIGALVHRLSLTAGMVVAGMLV
ncbi:MAG: hypothetical protein LQ348_006348 [Seirophora lacunosa]|nr:MAG: hypothetical protein LQ348_006348 [Seirophora lacunosa]